MLFYIPGAVPELRDRSREKHNSAARICLSKGDRGRCV